MSGRRSAAAKTAAATAALTVAAATFRNETDVDEDTRHPAAAATSGNNDDDEVAVLDLVASKDARSFPYILYDMISANNDVVRWEGEEGILFAVETDSEQLPEILNTHFGNGDVLSFQSRLFKYGWEEVDSDSNPETHAAYYHPLFCRDKNRAKLYSINRVRKSLTQPLRPAASIPKRTNNTNMSTTAPNRQSNRGRSSGTPPVDGDSSSKPRAVSGLTQVIEIDSSDDSESDGEIEVLKVVPASANPPAAAAAAAAAKTAPQPKDVQKSPELEAEETNPSLQLGTLQQSSLEGAAKLTSLETKQRRLTARKSTVTRRLPPAVSSTSEAEETNYILQVGAAQQSSLVGQSKRKLIARKSTSTRKPPSVTSTSSTSTNGTNHSSSASAESSTPPSTAKRPATVVFPQEVATLPPVATKRTQPAASTNGTNHSSSALEGSSTPPSTAKRPATVVFPQEVATLPPEATKRTQPAAATAAAATKQSAAAAAKPPAETRLKSPPPSENGQSSLWRAVTNPPLNAARRFPAAAKRPPNIDNERPPSMGAANCPLAYSVFPASAVARLPPEVPKPSEPMLKPPPSECTSPLLDSASASKMATRTTFVAKKSPPIEVGKGANNDRSTHSLTAVATAATPSSVAKWEQRPRTGRGRQSSPSTSSLRQLRNTSNQTPNNASASLASATAQSPRDLRLTASNVRKVSQDELRRVAVHWEASDKEAKARRNEVIAKCVHEKRDEVVREAQRRQQRGHQGSPHHHYLYKKRLGTTSGNVVQRTTAAAGRQTWTSSAAFMMMASHKGQQERLLVCNVHLEGAEEPQPRHNAPVSIRNMYAVDDKEELDFVPYFRDDTDDNGEQLTSLFETNEREKRFERGPLYLEEQTNDVIDRTLERVCEPFFLLNSDKAQLEDRVRHWAQAIAKLTGQSDEWLQERAEVFLRKAQTESQSVAQRKLPGTVGIEEEYLERVTNYRVLFCSRCFTYDCNIHGHGDKPSLKVQHERAIRRAEDGFWEDAEFAPASLSPRKLAPKQTGNDGRTSKPQALSDSQTMLCKKMFYIFEGDVAKIASALRAPINVISDIVASNDLKLPERRASVGKSTLQQKKPMSYHSMKNYKAKWLNRIKQANSHPCFKPCSHDEPCSEANCFCVQSAFFCMKVCAHAEYGPNFFRGCDCKGNCSQSSCSCFAANRECDPDLCKSCRACTDPPGHHETPKQNCCNDNISMKRHRRLLVGKSTVPNAGWGLFTKHRLRKGDFIHEYVGELVSQDEADRRFLQYDKLGYNYLFDQCSEYVIDGMHKGSKVRFANHSDDPNVVAKKMFVNGDQRIGFYACQNIAAQSELFFDYDHAYKGNFMNRKEGEKAES